MDKSETGEGNLTEPPKFARSGVRVIKEGENKPRAKEARGINDAMAELKSAIRRQDISPEKKALILALKPFEQEMHSGTRYWLIDEVAIVKFDRAVDRLIMHMEKQLENQNKDNT